MRPPDIELPRFLEAALSAGHPWVYRDHVPREFRASSGTVVRISAGAFTGYALWDAESQIALRVYSTREEPSAAWVAERVRQAWELRAMVRGSDTDAFRWVFGEGDGLPGIVVDLYGKWAVIALYADGLERIAEWVAEALRATTELAGLVRRGRDAGSRLEVVWGRKPPSDLVVAEHGVRMTADLELGQNPEAARCESDDQLTRRQQHRGGHRRQRYDALLARGVHGQFASCAGRSRWIAARGHRDLA